MKTGFIGIGNMGGALIKGYANTITGTDSADDTEIFIYDKDQAHTAKHKDLPGVFIVDSIDELVSSVHITVVAVKPNIFDEVLPIIKSHLTADKIIVSIAAGISIDYLEKQLGQNTKIVRSMPNLNSMLGYGMAALTRNEHVSDEDMTRVSEIFTASGKAIEVEEDQMDTVTGISGSSPAYAYMYIDALIECAVRNGMDREDAKVFACQSTLGAAMMIMESGIEPANLVDNVCSPGGTTIEAVTILKENGFKINIDEAMTAVIEKSKKMTK